MFIRPRGQNHRIVALHFLVALDQVGDESRIGRPDMGRGVDVIDGRGQVVFHREFFKYARFASARISLSGTPDSRAKEPSSEILTRTFPCGVSTSTTRRALTRLSAE